MNSQFISTGAPVYITLKTRTAEFVSPKHPDKICDQISDAILDAHLEQDPNARVAVDVAGGHGKLFITGEITSDAKDVDIERIAQKYVGSEVEIIKQIVQQSLEIARGVDVGGAGDQGIMTGYACAENDELLPIEYVLARDLCRFIYAKYPHDGKTQVSLTIFDWNQKFHNVNIDHVVISWQNVPKSKLKTLFKKWLATLDHTIIQANEESISINPAGDWNIGGFEADSGLTGRKIVVDNYGPRVPVGGGAFSGKDPSKVDRSAAYMARKIAVDYLKKYNAREVLVNIAYALGEPQPVEATAYIDGRRTIIKDYDLSPRAIIEELDLKKPNYAKRAMWGHLSRLD